MIKDLFKDIAQYFPSKLIPAIVGIVAIPILTRLLSPADYGNYVLVVATVSILCTLAGWVGVSIRRFYPAYEKEEKISEFTDLIIKLTFFSIVGISVAGLCIFFPLRNYLPRNFYRLMSIGIFVFVLTSLFSVLMDFLRINRQIKWYSSFFVWQRVTAWIFGVLLIVFLRLSAEGLLWGTVLSTGVALPLLWKIAVGKSHIHVTSRGIPLQPTIEMAKYSFPLVAATLAGWILALSDRYVLQFFGGPQEVGIYSISYQISQSSIMLLTWSFTLAFNPLSIIIWEKQGERASQEFLTKGTRYFLLLCIPGVIGISILGKPILNLLSTPDYYEGGKIIPLVVLGNFFRGLNQRFEAGLSFSKKTHFFMYGLTISSLLNLGLNFLLVPKYGYLAAAATTLVCYAFLLLLTIVISRHFFVWEFPFRSLARAACASAIMGIAVYHIGHSFTLSALSNLILSVVVGVIVYLLMLFLLREFGLSEVQALLGSKTEVCK